MNQMAVCRRIYTAADVLNSHTHIDKAPIESHNTMALNLSLYRALHTEILHFVEFIWRLFHIVSLREQQKLHLMNIIRSF